MSQEQYQQFVSEAQQSLQSGQFESALALAEQAVALDENNSEAYVIRGIALSQLNRSDEATLAFRDGIMHGPYNPKAYFNLAVHYFQLGEKLKAEEMAKETLKIEPNHGGARQLLSTIEAERAVPKTQTAYNPNDPLSGPPPDASTASTESEGRLPPGIVRPSEQSSASGISEPVSIPYSGPQPSQPAAPQPTGYYRPGYDTSHVHSLQFVANMGKGWDTIGLVLAGANVVIFVISIVMQWGAMMAAFSQGPGAQQQQDLFTMITGGNVVLSIFSLLVNVGALTWMIMELVDRRGNWLWMLPYTLCCCCCGLPGAIIGIYQWKGRG